MEWFWFAIAAPLLWGALNIIDKYFLDKLIKNIFSFLIFGLLTDAIMLPIIFFVIPISFNLTFAVISISSGLIVGLSYLFYNKAMMIEEASRVAPLIYINPLFVILLSIIFLNELLSYSNYIGIFLLISSAVLLSYKKVKGKKAALSPILFLMLLYSFIWAVVQVLSKWVLGYFDYWSFVFWQFFGAFLFGILLILIPKFRIRFVKDVKGKRAIWLPRIIGMIITWTAFISFYWAVSTGPVSLVAAVPAIQPFFVLLYTIFLSRFLPKIIKEEISRSILALKLIAVILVFVGTWLIVM